MTAREEGRFPDLMTAKEAAALVRVSPRQLDRLREKGCFPWYQIGERRMYDRADLLAWVETRKLAA